MMPDRPLIFLDPFARNEAMVFIPDVARAGPDGPRCHPLWQPRARCAGRAYSARSIGDHRPDRDARRAAGARAVHVLSAAPAMAEFCIGQAISLARGDTLFRAGAERYGNGGAYSLIGADVGLIAYGNLGRALVPLLKAFGCRIRAFDPWLTEAYLRADGIGPAPLDTVLRRSQFLFPLAGVTTRNQGFPGRDALATIRPDASQILKGLPPPWMQRADPQLAVMMRSR